MRYCPNCGRKKETSDRFCPTCGKLYPEEETRPSFERAREYVGTVRKCPSCGADVPSFTAVCPTCGHELNAAMTNVSQQEFIEQLNQCDSLIGISARPKRKGWHSWNMTQKVLWVILNVYTLGIPCIVKGLIQGSSNHQNSSLTPQEQRKASLIENYVVPNTRESILDALLFINSKMSFLAEQKHNSETAYWSGLWMTKAKDIYEKAVIIIPNDPIAAQTYQKILNIGEMIQKPLKRRALLCKIILAILILLFFASFPGRS